MKLKITNLAFVAILFLSGCSSSNEVRIGEVDSSSPSSTETPNLELELNPVNNISHAHGLAVDAIESNKLYIATHTGLLLLMDDKDLYRIGDIQDDFMGFSAHPEDPTIYFTSGHPKQGGNIGVQRSNDGGMSWQKISDGLSGPVDFHSMTISPSNPNVLYGWHGGLQRSTDGGETWVLMNSEPQNVISLTADAYDENVVYASTTKGLFISKDQGETWATLSETLNTGVVTAVGVDPINKNNMISFSETLGLLKSVDGGQTWESIEVDLGFVLYFAFDQNQSNTLYALNKESAIYKSIDGGQSWNKLK